MCIEPPRPRFVPASLAISSANIPSGSRPFARQWPWPRCVDVMTSAGAERPARADGRRLLPDRQVHEARAPRRRGRAPATRSSKPRITSIRRCSSRRSASLNMRRVLYWSVQRRARRPMTEQPEQIDIPASFAGGADVTGKRVVITGASRGLGRLLAHAFSHSGARVALVARTESDLKAVADELPGPSLVCSGEVTDERLQRSGRRCHRGRVGRRRCVDLQRRDLAHPGRPARDRSVGLARDPRREPHRRVPRRARRCSRDGRRRAIDLHRLRARRTAARRASPRTAPRRPGSSGWRRDLRSISRRPASP